MDELKLQIALSKARLDLKATQKALSLSDARKNQLEAAMGVMAGEVTPGYPNLRTLIDVRTLAQQELAHVCM